jgi:hypothetical protein
MDQAPIEEEVTVGLYEQCFLVVAVLVDGGAGTCARCAYGRAITLPEKARTKREGIVSHDDVKAFQEFLGRECSGKVGTMKFEPPTDHSGVMVIVDILLYIRYHRAEEVVNCEACGEVASCPSGSRRDRGIPPLIGVRYQSIC